MSEINSFSDYASKYNTNVDYSYLFGGMQTPSTGSAFNLSDYAAIKNGSYGKLLKAYYAKQDAEKASSGGDTVQKSTLMKSGADALKKSADALNNDELWEKKKIKKKDEKTGEEIEVEDYDWEAITKAVKSFVEDYNDVVEQAGNSNSKDVLRNAVWMTGITESNENMLSKIGITVGNRHLLQMYIKYGIGITNLAISNLRSEQVYIRGFLEDLNQSETENVCMVTSQQMDEYFRAEQLREVKEETYNKKVMCILHFFNYLKVKGHIERIPFDPDYYIKKTFQQHHDRSVEQEVMDEIMANLYKFSEDTRLMFLHLWGIGLRLSEVCTLKGNAYYMQGHDAWIQVYQIKMRTYKRIPIPMALYKLMKVYIAKYNRKADEYIFQNQKGGAYHKGTFKNKMIKACKECNVQNGEYIFRSHDYRHTIATAFYDTGVPIQSIRDYLGHDYEEMTRQYVDFMPKKIEKANEEYFKKGSLASCLRKGVNDNGE